MDVDTDPEICLEKEEERETPNKNKLPTSQIILLQENLNYPVVEIGEMSDYDYKTLYTLIKLDFAAMIRDNLNP